MTGGAAGRAERLLTLVFVLLNTRRGVTRDKLRSTIPDYADSASEQAFERMFERDKEALRDLGIPVETVQLDSFHDDEWAYRIDPASYQLPQLSFTSDEVVALGLAGRAWRQAALEGEAAAALHKLESLGVDLSDDVAAIPVEPRLGVTEPLIPVLVDAAVEGRSVSFDYRKRGGEPEPRRLEPWGVVLRKGSAYVVGHDIERDAVRAFRVSRIEGQVRSGPDAASHVPPGVDLRALVGSGEPGQVSGTATLRVAPGRAMTLRRTAGAHPDEPEFEVGYRALERFAAEVAAYGPDVQVLEPAELRAAVIARLQGVLA